MLEVNIWHPTREKFVGKRIANPMTRTIFALFSLEEHIGHAQVSVTRYGDEKALQSTIETYPNLNFTEASPTYKKTTADQTKFSGKLPSALDNSYESIAARAIHEYTKVETPSHRDETELIQGVTVSNSLWPKQKPGGFKNLVQGFFQFGNKGKVEPLYSDTAVDMLSEQEHKRAGQTIQHRQTFLNKNNQITPEIKQLQDTIEHLKSKRITLVKQLEKLYRKHKSKERTLEIEKLVKAVIVIDDVMKDVEAKLKATDAPRFTSPAEKELEALQAEKRVLQKKLQALANSELYKKFIADAKSLSKKCEQFGLLCTDESTTKSYLMTYKAEWENSITRLENSEKISDKMRDCICKHIEYQQLVDLNIATKEQIEEFKQNDAYIKANIIIELNKDKKNWKEVKDLMHIRTIIAILKYSLKYYELAEKQQSIEEQIDKLNPQIQLAAAKLLNWEETNGKNTNATIILPTSETKHFNHYYIDEEKVLEHMQNQRNDKNYKYDFLKNNCAKNARECVLAGISEEMKAAIKNLNTLTVKEGGFTKEQEKFRVTETFFNKDKDFDMPARLEIWLNKLAFYIEKVNGNYYRDPKNGFIKKQTVKEVDIATENRRGIKC